MHLARIVVVVVDLCLCSAHLKSQYAGWLASSRAFYCARCVRHAVRKPSCM